MSRAEARRVTYPLPSGRQLTGREVERVYAYMERRVPGTRELLEDMLGAGMNAGMSRALELIEAGLEEMERPGSPRSSAE